ncbi:hypothetical protein [Segniliparus rugosus]|uniref:Lipoprotein n=1 Tax=Segniliparus rugosus (strain ATCC BAA-974 / DSM 45345 / CCUG 50838 / CIP 108380 / JCM 13579 / CDC 945) TaxID=679197 RepID=E5XUM6_SEGRC|nr:hypothetical protein [Segniliparus rugosus]EFV11950.2 hypothetical protein HMPREF9336_03198 [Segniliparus rugosus ATCC BAA-974]
MTTRAALFGAFAVAVAAAGCAHSDKSGTATPTQAASTAPAITSSVSSADSAAAKKTFCDVYSQEIQKAEDTTARFAAASRGDEQHPQTNWDDPDHWFRDSADDASIIFGYAADTLQAQVTSSLTADLGAKAKALIASMRKLSELYQQHEAVATLREEMKNGYAPSANDIDKLCDPS